MKVLVANRGEIACRVLHTLRQLEIESVAVYTEPDHDAPHRWLAEQAVCLDGVRGYLDVDQVLAAVKESGATAVHPGYGFLSENTRFVRACDDAGITFIGPCAETMEQLGDKRAARILAESVDVPVVPGAESVDTVEQAKSAAESVGYPVLIKAAGGGGGRGMRQVMSADRLESAFAAARHEADVAFSDPRLLVEKYIYPARHVEIQILADGKDSLALGERECSLQRRYQKIVEESPSPGIGEGLRTQLCDAAVKLTKAAKYSGAGTVEFLVGPDNSFYFLEVNTRLQVEHPITEERFGIDLVAAQIDLAHGGPLPKRRDPRGYAIEVRLNAEDAYAGFLPATGDVLLAHWPHIPGVRIDTGIESGQAISPDYDSLIAKVIAYGETRETARRKLLHALKSIHVLGLKTNLNFLIDVLDRDFFKDGETFTSTIEAETWQEAAAPDFVAEFAGAGTQKRKSTGQAGADIYNPWQNLGAFRMGHVEHT